MSDNWPDDYEYALLEKHFHALGLVVCRWNVAESTFLWLIAEAAGLSEVMADALLTHIGNQTASDALRTIIHHTEPDQPFMDVMREACALFDINRENRNMLCHAAMLPHVKADGTLIAAGFRLSAKGRIKRTKVEFPLEDIRLVSDQIDAFMHFVASAADSYSRRRNGQPYTLPEILPRPRKLSCNPTIDPLDAPPQP